MKHSFRERVVSCNPQGVTYMQASLLKELETDARDPKATRPTRCKPAPRMVREVRDVYRDILNLRLGM